MTAIAIIVTAVIVLVVLQYWWILVVPYDEMIQWQAYDIVTVRVSVYVALTLLAYLVIILSILSLVWGST